MLPLPPVEGHGRGALGGDEREQPVRQARVRRDLREPHSHRVVELIVHLGAADEPLARIDLDDEAGEGGLAWPEFANDADKDLKW